MSQKILNNKRLTLCKVDSKVWFSVDLIKESKMIYTQKELEAMTYGQLIDVANNFLPSHARFDGEGCYWSFCGSLMDFMPDLNIYWDSPEDESHVSSNRFVVLHEDTKKAIIIVFILVSQQ